MEAACVRESKEIACWSGWEFARGAPSPFGECVQNVLYLLARQTP